MTAQNIIPVCFLTLVLLVPTTFSAKACERLRRKCLATNTSTDEQRLLDTLMLTYSKDSRPVYNASHPVKVKIGITLTQIFDVDEKNQVLITNVWLDQEWHDEKIKWNPKDYNGLSIMRIPCTKLWLPDIVLYNSASDYNQKYMEALAMVSHDGNVFWPPIVKLRSTCLMDVTYFPFDDQVCKLKLGSWAYDGFQIDVVKRSDNVDLSKFVENGEWELISAKAKRNVVYYTCCPEPFPDVTFYIHIKRRTTYYFYNVIIPSVMLSSLALLGFWLHPDSGEKITLGLTVLLALSVFMLLIAENTPATSFFVPLLGIYLTTAMSFTSLSVIFAVMVSNLHIRGANPGEAPKLLRSVTVSLSKLLCMRLHYLTETSVYNHQVFAQTLTNPCESNRNSTSLNGTVHGPSLSLRDGLDAKCQGQKCQSQNNGFNQVVLETLKNLLDKQEENDRETRLKGEWEEIARVMDRFLFCIFLFGMTVSTVYLLAVLPLTRPPAQM